jgi:hypothetical protein
MHFERMRARRALGIALAAGALAAASAAAATAAPAGQGYASSRTVGILRTAGTCPPAVTLVTRARQYEGGAEFEITAQTKSFATPSRAVASKVPRRVEFVATSLAAPYAACEGTARFTESGSTYSLTLHDGTMRFVALLSREMVVVAARVVGGNPTIRAQVAD